MKWGMQLAIKGARTRRTTSNIGSGGNRAGSSRLVSLQSLNSGNLSLDGCLSVRHG